MNQPVPTADEQTRAAAVHRTLMEVYGWPEWREPLPALDELVSTILSQNTNDKNRDVRWAWEADEAKQLADNTMAKAQREPAGPRHETLMKQAETVRWMLEEIYVSLWAQELGTPKPISLQRIKKAIA